MTALRLSRRLIHPDCIGSRSGEQSASDNSNGHLLCQHWAKVISSK